MQGCYLTVAQLPVAALTISSRATKILNQEPAWVPKNYDSWQYNSLCAHFQWRNDRIPACSFGTFETKCLLTLTVGKKFTLLKVNKQALYWKFKTQTNQVSRYSWIEFWVNLLNYFICLSYRSLWAPRNVALSSNFIFKEPERLPKIFLDSSLDRTIAG